MRFRTISRLLSMPALLISLGALSSPTIAQTNGGDDRRPDISYVIVDGVSIPDPLSEVVAMASEGRAIFIDPKRGACVECHSVGGAGGDSASALDGVSARLSKGALRLWIANPAALADAPAMPAYYTLAPARAGESPRVEPKLSADQIEHLVAYLSGLTAAPAE